MNALTRARLAADAVWPVRRLMPDGGVAGAARLATVLRPTPASLADPAVRTLHVAASLAVGVRGAAFLLRVGPEGARRRRALGVGLAQYEVSGWPEPFWVDVGRDTARGGWGPPPRPFDVRICFADSEQALRAQREELDMLVEIGAGRLVAEGCLPLADGLKDVMHEVETLLGGR